MRVERSVSIARPPDDVLSYVADVRNEPNWHTDILEVRPATDSVAVGSVYNVKVKPSMGVSEGTLTISRLEPGKLVEFQGRMGKMKPTVTNLVGPEGGGTRFTRRVELDPPGLMKIMSPMIKMMIGKSNNGFLANLKRVLEAKS